MTLDGTEFPIVEPTRVAGVLAHESGVLTTITTTDDANGPARYGVEVHGLDGSLLGGDPNTFDGPVILARRGELDQTLPLVSQWNENSRGLGLQDLCRAVRDGTPQRASGDLGLQVVETLLEMRELALQSAHAVSLNRRHERLELARGAGQRLGRRRDLLGRGARLLGRRADLLRRGRALLVDGGDRRDARHPVRPSAGGLGRAREFTRVNLRRRPTARGRPGRRARRARPARA